MIKAIELQTRNSGGAEEITGLQLLGRRVRRGSWILKIIPARLAGMFVLLADPQHPSCSFSPDQFMACPISLWSLQGEDGWGVWDMSLPMAEHCNAMVFKDHSNPNHSVTP